MRAWARPRAGSKMRVPAMQGKPSPILDPLLPMALDTSGYKPLSCGVTPVGSHRLGRCADFTAVRWVSNVNSAVTPGGAAVLGCERPQRVLAAVATRGKGRVVAYNRCYAEFTYGYPFLPVPRSQELEPEERTGKQCRWLNGREHVDQFYGWLGHALLWAARKEPAVTVKAMTVAEERLALSVANGTGERQSCLLRVHLRSPYDTRTETVESPVELSPRVAAEVELRLPETGYLGRHHVDAFLVDEKERIWDWGSTSLERTGRLAVELAPDFELRRPNGIVPLRLRVSGADACTVRTELLDLDGRLLIDRTERIKLQANTRKNLEVLLSLSESGITTRLANVRVTVRAGKETVEVRDQLQVQQDPGWDSFHVMAYDGVRWYGHAANDVLVKVLKGMGHDTLLLGYPTPFTARQSTETGCRVVANNLAPWCRYDADRLKTLTGWLRKLGPVLYELQDEPELQFAPAVEGRFASPKDRTRFRAWLQTKYGTLAAVNAAWDTQYEKWEAVKRVRWHEVAGSANWARWFDSRRDLDRSMVEKLGSCADAIRAVEPAAFCNINVRSLGTLSAIDLREMGRRLGAGSLYYDYVRRGPIGYLHLGSRWFEPTQSCVGYTWPSSPGVKRITREAWDAVRHGVRNLTWFAPQSDCYPPSATFRYLRPDLTPNAKGEAIAEINKLLLSGPGQLAAATKPLSEGVFIYYPRTLFYAQTLDHMKRQLEGNPELAPKTLRGIHPGVHRMLPCSFVPHLRSLGYQFELGDEKDLDAQRLGQTRVVFLSHVACLGQREQELLRDFAGRGGCVIAEAGAGRRDESGRLYSETPAVFRQLFGVERVQPNPSPSVEKEGIRPCGAEHLGWVSPFLGAAYRKGNAFFLNFKLPRTWRACRMIRRMLEDSGVRPTYHMQRNYIEPDSGQLVASLVARQRGSLSYLYLTGDGNRRDSAFCVELPQPRYVYDVLEDAHLGLKQQIEGHIDYGEVALFALSPVHSRAFSIHTSKEPYRPGETLAVRFALTAEPKGPGDRLVRLTYWAEKPGPGPAIPGTLLLHGGVGELKAVLPLNCASGKAWISARDLTSGAQCRALFEVLPSVSGSVQARD